MKKKIIQNISIFFFLFVYKTVFTQNLSLKIASKNKKEAVVLSKMEFVKTHIDSITIYKEIYRISEELKQNGYFSNSIDKITKENNIFTCFLTLGNKIDKAIINLPITIQNLLSQKKVTISIEELSSFLNNITHRLDIEGNSFSEIQLKNIRLEKNLLFANLSAHISKKRVINNIIIKGYDNFPKSYIKYFFNLKKGNTFNQQVLKNSSIAIKSLNFISEIKPPEVLFLKDSTILYMYLKKKKVSSFDGLLNFSSDKNKKSILFNGHINLKLNNILHTGEEFNLLWKANGDERQDFNIYTKIPYIFNSPFSPDLSFNLYKQDSTFLNTKFYGGVQYTLNYKTSATLTYNTTSSKNTLQNTISNNIADFHNYFLGLKITYKTPDKYSFFQDKFYINIHPLFGQRTSNNTKEKQFKINISTAYLWQLNYKNAIFLKNETGYLSSDTFLENELYRIGGTNSIRGFNEQSIFTPKFSYITIEYRYLTANNTYIYSITDFGQAKVNNNIEQLTGIGLGYLFKIKNSQIKLEYLIGKNTNTDFILKNSKIGIQFINYF